ncbi:MarR family winged helix-turn-helix transcriptional regulator [Leeia oryzae]|uniref:MarR family winged helix-turn-helix transcriptional regulator n=1 Tax=Leeia oryzae TaxID=356662 RepID=UPI00037DB86A|nr:MarR family transcriptional regulator [Leeia oryzae]
MNPDDLLKLDAQLCFRLYAASRAMTRTYQPLLAGLDLTYPQYLVMLVLWEKDDITVKQIGEKLALDSGTLTPLLKRLEHSGFIIRQRRAENEREVRILLTSTGRNLKEKAKPIPAQMFEHFGITLEEITELKRLLDQITGSACSPENPASSC